MTKYIIFSSFKNSKNIYDICNNFTKQNINIINILKIKLINTNNNYIINLLKNYNNKFIEYLKLNSVTFDRCYNLSNQFFLLILDNKNDDFILKFNEYNLEYYITDNNLIYNFLINNFKYNNPYNYIFSFSKYNSNDEIKLVDINNLRMSLANYNYKFKIENTPFYKYLIGNKNLYINYIKLNLGGITTDNHTEEAYLKLIKDFEYGKIINNYKSYIIISKNFNIVDGSHRAAILKYKINNNEIKNKYIKVYVKSN